MSSLKNEKIEKLFPITISALSLLFSVITLSIVLKNSKNYVDNRFQKPEIILHKDIVEEDSIVASENNKAENVVDDNLTINAATSQNNNSLENIANEIENGTSAENKAPVANVPVESKKVNDKKSNKKDVTVKNHIDKAEKNSYQKTILQVGSFPAKKVAEGHCNILKQKHKNITGKFNLECSVVEKTVKDKKVFRAILKTKNHNFKHTEAVDTCKKLENNKIRCIVFN